MLKDVSDRMFDRVFDRMIYYGRICIQRVCHHLVRAGVAVKQCVHGLLTGRKPAAGGGGGRTPFLARTARDKARYIIVIDEAAEDDVT